MVLFETHGADIHALEEREFNPYDLITAWILRDTVSEAVPSMDVFNAGIEGSPVRPDVDFIESR